MTIAAAGAAGAAVVTAAARVVAADAWNRATAQAARRLADAAHANAEQRSFDSTDLAGLPVPVARYFLYALAARQRMIAQTRVTLSGTLRTRADGPWKPFTAQERFTAQPAGFVSDAAVRIAPLIDTRIRDTLIAGSGASEAVVAGCIAVAGPANGAAMSAAALVRFLAEAVWFPTSLLPRFGVVWTAVPGGGNRATLTNGDAAVAIDVEFGAECEIVGVRALRFRAVGKTMLLTPWFVRYRGYQRVAGIMVPAEVDVGWAPPEGEYLVWRGRLLTTRYDFARRLPDLL